MRFPFIYKAYIQMTAIIFLVTTKLDKFLLLRPQNLVFLMDSWIRAVEMS